MFRMFALASLCLAMSVNELRAQEEAVGEAVAVAEPSTDADKTPTLRPLTVTTGLTDDTLITGTLLDTNSIAIKTAFGEASIPLSEVAGIRFPSAEDTSTTIVMLNGDSITGATDVKFVNVETSWGNAKINGPSVATMLFVPGLTWQNSDSLGGKRWTLTDQKATPPRNAASTQPGQPGLPGQTGQPGQPARPGQPGVPGRVSNSQPQVIFGN